MGWLAEITYESQNSETRSLKWSLKNYLTVFFFIRLPAFEKIFHINRGHGFSKATKYQIFCFGIIEIL